MSPRGEQPSGSKRSETVRRTIDALLVNRLVGRDFPGCDLSEALAEPLHVCLVEGESGAMFAWRGPGIYEVHLFYSVRGRSALSLFRAMLAKMAIDHDARVLWGLVPVESRHVRMFVRLAGWKSRGVLQTRHGPQELFVENCRCPSV